MIIFLNSLVTRSTSSLLILFPVCNHFNVVFTLLLKDRNIGKTIRVKTP